MDVRAQRDALLHHILNAEREEAKRLLLSIVHEDSYETALRDILEPTLRLIGDRWSKDAISLAQGFVAGKVAEDFIANTKGHLLTEMDKESPIVEGSPPRAAVLGNIEDDYHSLGRSMVISFLELRGWSVTDLGNDVLARDLVDTAVRIGAPVIGVSAMMLTTARNILSVRQALRERGLENSIALAVGGAVFRMRPELAAEVGGDGTADTGIDAPDLFESLRLRIYGNQRRENR
ncbi:MAG TPA: cobalamin-dependent protein [bacterium]|nr:cobalamin-dependent protein [bacterium]